MASDQSETRKHSETSLGTAGAGQAAFQVSVVTHWLSGLPEWL